LSTPSATRRTPMRTFHLFLRIAASLGAISFLVACFQDAQSSSKAPPTAPGVRVQAIAVQPDGRLLVGGQGRFVAGSGPWALARYNTTSLNSTGSIEGSATFHPGIVDSEAFPFNEVASIAVLADGRILIGGFFPSLPGAVHPGLARLRPNGSVDATFQPALPADTEVGIIVHHRTDPSTLPL